MFGDIAVNTGFMNADPCTAHTCKWPKSSNGKVYVPYVISNQYCKYFSSLKWFSSELNGLVLLYYMSLCVRVCIEFLTFLLLHWAAPQERSVIEGGLQTFAASTCVRFFPRTNQRDFVDIQSLSGYDRCTLRDLLYLSSATLIYLVFTWQFTLLLLLQKNNTLLLLEMTFMSSVYTLVCSCFSYVGRQKNGQVLSLKRKGCVHQSVVQHELLHALGFRHEHSRSDRDSHVQILTQNILPG